MSQNAQDCTQWKTLLRSKQNKTKKTHGKSTDWRISIQKFSQTPLFNSITANFLLGVKLLKVKILFYLNNELVCNLLYECYFNMLVTVASFAAYFLCEIQHIPWLSVELNNNHRTSTGGVTCKARHELVTSC